MIAGPKSCVHATTISINGTGVLICGPSGSGKSSLALQLLESTGTGLTPHALEVRLVADDQTELTESEGKLFAAAPAPIIDLLEIRGVGILKLPAVSHVPLCLVVTLKPFAEIERLPNAANMFTNVLGVTLPRVYIDANTNAAAARLRVAWARLQQVL